MIDPTTETLLTMPQAGRRLGKHPDTIRNWITRGALDGVKVAGKWHTSLEAITRATEAVRQEPVQARPGSDYAEAMRQLRAAGMRV